MRILAVTFLLLLAGCTGPDYDAYDDPEAESGGEGGSQGSSGESSSGDVTIRKDGDTYIATRIVDADGPFLKGADITLDTTNGFVTLAGTRSSGYALTATLEGRGDSESEARERLDALGVDIGDAGGLSITGTNSDHPDWQGRSVSLDVSVPSNVGHIDIDTTNGFVTLEDLDADNVNVDTLNGFVEGTMAAHDVHVTSSNGFITWVGDVADFIVSTSNAFVTVDVRPIASGTWDIDTLNGAIHLTLVEDASRGYDIRGSTTNGAIDFDFKDTEEVSTGGGFVGQERHEKTVGYETRATQVSVDLDTMNGGITGRS